MNNRSDEDIRRQTRTILRGLADETYREFHSGLVPGKTNILGVRVPKLRELAKTIAKTGLPFPDGTAVGWAEYLQAAGAGRAGHAAVSDTDCSGHATGPAANCSGQATDSDANFSGHATGSGTSCSGHATGPAANCSGHVASTDAGCSIHATGSDANWAGSKASTDPGPSAAENLDPPIYYEEILLQGLVIGCAKMPFDELLSRTAAFVPLIDNWAVCDTFCTSLKAAKKHMAEFWDFLQPYLALGLEQNPQDPQGHPAQTEFPLRFAVVMLLAHYINEGYIDRVLTLLNSVKHEGYYVKMAVAWALSVCFIKFPEKTMELLDGCNELDDFTYNKAIQKTIESFRVDAATKDRLRSMKRR